MCEDTVIYLEKLLHCKSQLRIRLRLRVKDLTIKTSALTGRSLPCNCILLQIIISRQKNLEIFCIMQDTK